MLQKGFMQELYYRKTKNLLSARLWYQSADRNLPTSMLIQQTGNNEKQIDESVRTMINYEGCSGRSEYFLTGSFLVSKLNYSNDLATIDSRNKSESLVLKAGLANRIGESIRTKVVLDNEHTIVKSVNYDENSNSRNIASLTAIAEINSTGRLAATLLLREILNGNSFLVPDLSAGMQLQITDGRDYYIKANYSRNSKLPSMNDLFWVPGGNPDLINETANMFEVIYEMDQKISSPVDLKFNLSVYHNSIKDMIQWQPGLYAYWTAGNVKSVNTSGIETSVSFNYSINKVSSILNLGYTYTDARTTGSDIPNDESTGKQLIYVPGNQATASFRFSYLDFYALWISGYTGRRYTTSDNSAWLPGYFLNSVSSGYSFHNKANIFRVSLSVENIFNISYETIAFYPQPGRSYSLRLLIQFNK
jgi:iron complex outermembrane receptor protein